MAIDLKALVAKFRNVSDVETDHALFRTNVPSVAPQGYLNMLFKPASANTRENVARRLQLPAPLLEFFAQSNGARLFFDGIAIYGCWSEHQMFDRTNPFGHMPFNIEGVNREFAKATSTTHLLCIGSYNFDRSIVCIDRTALGVTCFVGKDFTRKRRTWPSLDDWLVNEIKRVCALHDEFGNCLVDKKLLLPED
jgi:hypothetical protein